MFAASAAPLSQQMQAAGGISNDLLLSLSMNFNNSGASHKELADNLKKNAILKSPLLEYAFRKLDRAHFDPSPTPYEDKPHDIGRGATITSAHMHCLALEALVPSLTASASASAPTDTRVLVDVGSGSGYVAAMLAIAGTARLDGPRVAVFALELDPALLQQSEDNVAASAPALLAPHSPRALEGHAVLRFHAGDAFDPRPDAAVTAALAPFAGTVDAVHVGVAVAAPPLHLLALLRPGSGRMVVPVARPGSVEQDLTLFTRKPLSACTPATTEVTESTLDTLFDRSVVMRCVYSTAQSAVTSASSAFALNPRATPGRDALLGAGAASLAPGAGAGVGAGADSSRYFRSLDGPEDPEVAAKVRAAAAAAAARVAAEAAEAAARAVAGFRTEKTRVEAELARTSDEVKSWHQAYTAREGRKPSLADMQADAVASRLLAVVKAMRTELARIDSALEAANAAQTKQQGLQKAASHHQQQHPQQQA